jgi:hypothetical protein
MIKQSQEKNIQMSQKNKTSSRLMMFSFDDVVLFLVH